MDQKTFFGLLTSAVQNKASDIHLASGTPPAFRLKGELVNVKIPPLTESDIMTLLKWCISDQKILQKLDTLFDYDGSFEIKEVSRFRYNIFRHRGSLGVILRVIPSEVPSIESLGLPQSLKDIAELQRGLVLVTGATGSGKSSTLAAMIQHMNKTSNLHIITIEDPIEFVHSPKKSRITQRELGRDTTTYAEALRSALRQDPDVILVGEMRDIETIDIALKAAETGHLVLATVHTTDAIRTINRLVSVFPAEEQKMVRLRLSDNLAATISQRLVVRSDKKGMIAAQEIMISNQSIAECISNPELTGQMNDFIEKSHNEVEGVISGGQTFDQHLTALYKAKLITEEVALAACTNRSNFERFLLLASAQNQEEGVSLRSKTPIILNKK
ncbi:MAG: type IV pilus twitching motility protein PilT [Bdellovibrionia bacterium]